VSKCPSISSAYCVIKKQIVLVFFYLCSTSHARITNWLADNGKGDCKKGSREMSELKLSCKEGWVQRDLSSATITENRPLPETLHC